MLLLGTAVFSSCFRDEYDFENLTVDYSPTFALPLIEANVSTADLLSDIDTTLIKADGNNLLRLSIVDTLQSITLADLLGNDPIESESVTKMAKILDGGTKAMIEGLALTTLYLGPQYPLSGATPGGVRFTGLDSLGFASGNLNFTLKNNTPVAMLKVNIDLTSVGNNTLIGQVQIDSLPAGGDSTVIIDLAGKVLTDSLDFALTTFGTPTIPNATLKTISAAQYDYDLVFAASMTNLDVNFYEGDLSGNLIPSTTGTQAVDLSDPLLSAFTVKEPEVSIYFDNAFGTPFELSTVDFTMKGGSSPVTVTGNPAFAPFSISQGTVDRSGTTPTVNAVTSTLVMNATNSNIADGLNSQPSSVDFTVAGHVDSVVSRVHYADKNSYFRVRMSVDVPVYGKMKDLGVKDTIDFDGSIFETAKSITLRAVIENGFPLDGEIQMVFTDASYNVLDSLVGSTGDGTFMSASGVAATGEATTPTTKKTDFVIGEVKAKKLVNAKYALLRVSINSANASDVKILSTYKMKIKLGVIAKISTTNLTSEE